MRLDAVDDLGGTRATAAISAPMIACEPSTSWVTALPMSWSNAPRFGTAKSMPSSAAIAAAMCADSTVLGHVLPVRRAELQPPEQPDHLRVQVRDAGVEHRLLAGAPDLLVDLLLRAFEHLLDRGWWIRPSCTSFSA